MIGGYKILDLKGLNLDSGTTIKGIYEKLLAIKKPILVENIHTADIDVTAGYVTLVANATYLMGVIGATHDTQNHVYYLKVDNQNLVSVVKADIA